MTVTFVYRSFDMGPTGKYLKRFEDSTVLDWFRRHWDHLAVEDFDEADRRLEKVLGCDTGFVTTSPFLIAAQERQPSPESHDELKQRLEAGYSAGCVHFDASDVLQILTEDDGEGGAVYFFDDRFLKRAGERAAYLLHEDWRLPSGHKDGEFILKEETIRLEPGGKGMGTTYCVLLAKDSKYPLDNLDGGYQIEGIRLPELARYLIHTDSIRNGYLRRLPALLLAGVQLDDPLENALLESIQKNPEDIVSWRAWSDWREERGEEATGISLLRKAFSRLSLFPGWLLKELSVDADLKVAGQRLRELETYHAVEMRSSPHSLIHAENYLAQMCLDTSWSDTPYFHQWIFFDDLWASAHPDLANAILRFAYRWDVLSLD